MKRLLIVLVASLVLGLVGGVGRAYAGDLLSPPPAPDTTQSATQSNSGSNSADQSATSEPTVVSGPNIALANGSSCSPCGGSGTTTQNSGNNVDASATNTATQSNNQSNAAGQTQTVSGGSGNTSQSADQSNSGSNDASQSAKSKPVVVSGPNVAALNSGDVSQNSGNNVDASTSNNAKQSNNQTNGAGQSQTVSGGSCCHSGGDPSQSASQSNDGSNSADQSATSEPVVISGGNYAILNKGDVNQNSGNNVWAPASNNADQSNTQHNALGQSQTVADGGNCCSKHSSVSQSADQSNSGSNSAYQTAYSAPVVVSGPNVAVGNGWVDKCSPCGGEGGDVNQNSGNNVWAPASNNAKQSNWQSNSLGQSQTVTGNSGCCSGHDDVSQSADQSNHAENSADQYATSTPFVVSGGNLALLNGGDVNQNSGNNVWAPASNTATQSNRQSNTLGQSQTVTGSGCCSKGDVEQTASQCNTASNDTTQRAEAAPVVLSGWNGSAFNFGTVHQNSGSNVWAPASNTATQTNNQSNTLGQTQTVDRGGSCENGCESECKPECDSECKPECEPRCNPCDERCDTERE